MRRLVGREQEEAAEGAGIKGLDQAKPEKRRYLQRHDKDVTSEAGEAGQSRRRGRNCRPQSGRGQASDCQERVCKYSLYNKDKTDK